LVLSIASLAKTLGTRIIVTNPSPIRWSGPEDKTDAQLRFQARSLDRLGAALKVLGLKPAYHNHDAERRQGASACGMPDYGVRFQFLHGQDELDVLLCFHCDHIGIFRDGQFVEQEEFNVARPALLSIVQELFPDAPVISALTPSR
jgi:hypothetical protein